MSDILSHLVEAGKDDVLQFIRQHIFKGVKRGDGASIYSLFYLSVKKEKAELDIIRTRALIIEENEAFLGEVDADNPHLVYAMARAAGRVSQMRECLAAVDRIILANADGDEARVQDFEGFRSFLLGLEKMAVKLRDLPDGQFGLMPLDDVYETAQAIVEVEACRYLH